MNGTTILIEALDNNTRSNDRLIAVHNQRTKTLARMNWFIGICLSLNFIIMLVSFVSFFVNPYENEPGVCESAAKVGSFLLKIGSK